MDSANLLKTSVFISLPLLALLRLFYGLYKHRQYGTQKISIFSIAKLEASTNLKLVLMARIVIGTSIVAYSIITVAIILYRIDH